ncbi:DUF6660 family protein [Lutibacter sp.]
MKLFAIILSILTLTLSALPCDDSISIETSQTAFHSVSDTNTLHTDLCSPFCACVCCASIAVDYFLSPYTINQTHFSSLKKNTHYTSLYSNQFLANIFQPPKV